MSCLWCQQTEWMVDRLQSIADGSESDAVMAQMAKDLQQCCECVAEYHRACSGWLRDTSVAAYSKRLFKRDVSRLTRHLRAFLVKSEHDDTAQDGQAHSVVDLEKEVKASLYEVLLAPALLWDEELADLFVRSLLKYRDLGGYLDWSEKLPGIYLLLVYPDLNVSVWAWEVIREAGEINEDDYLDVEEVVSWIVLAVEGGLCLTGTPTVSPMAPTIEYYSFHDSSSSSTPLCSHLRCRAGHQLNFFWLGVERLLKIVSPDALRRGLLATHRKFIDALLTVLKQGHKTGRQELHECYWIVLRCAVFLLHTLNSAFWQYCSEEPSSMLEMIALHSIYQKEMHRLARQSRQHILPGSSGDNRRQCTFGWFVPFILSMLKFGNMAENAFSSTIRYLCKIWGVVVKNMGDREAFKAHLLVEDILDGNRLAVECCLAVMRLLRAALENDAIFLARRTCKTFWLPLMLCTIQAGLNTADGDGDDASGGSGGAVSAGSGGGCAGGSWAGSRFVVREVSAIVRQLLLTPVGEHLDRSRSELMDSLFSGHPSAEGGVAGVPEIFSGWQVQVTHYVYDMLDCVAHLTTGPGGRTCSCAAAAAAHALPTTSSRMAAVMEKRADPGANKTPSKVDVIEILDSDEEDMKVDVAPVEDVAPVDETAVASDVVFSPIHDFNLDTDEDGAPDDALVSPDLPCSQRRFPRNRTGSPVSHRHQSNARVAPDDSSDESDVAVSSQRSQQQQRRICTSSESEGLTSDSPLHTSNIHQYGRITSDTDTVTDTDAAEAPIVLESSDSEHSCASPEYFPQRDRCAGISSSCPVSFAHNNNNNNNNIPLRNISMPLHRMTVEKARQEIAFRNECVAASVSESSSEKGQLGFPSLDVRSDQRPASAVTADTPSWTSSPESREGKLHPLDISSVHTGPLDVGPPEKPPASLFDFGARPTSSYPVAPADGGSNVDAAALVSVFRSDDPAPSPVSVCSSIAVSVDAAPSDVQPDTVGRSDGDAALTELSLFDDQPDGVTADDFPVDVDAEISWLLEATCDFSLEADMMADFQASQPMESVPDALALDAPARLPAPVSPRNDAPSNARLVAGSHALRVPPSLHTSAMPKSNVPHHKLVPPSAPVKEINLTFARPRCVSSLFEAVLSWRASWFLYPTIDPGTGAPQDVANAYREEKKIGSLPLKFKSMDDYIELFQPLLRSEVWHQISGSVAGLYRGPCPELFRASVISAGKSPPNTQRSRQVSVQGCLPPAASDRRGPLSERDLVLIYTCLDSGANACTDDQLHRSMRGESSTKKYLTRPFPFPSSCTSRLAAVEPVFGIVQSVEKRKQLPSNLSANLVDGEAVDEHGLLVVMTVHLLVDGAKLRNLTPSRKVFLVIVDNLISWQRCLVGLLKLPSTSLCRDVLSPRGEEYFSSRGRAVPPDQIARISLPFNTSQKDIIGRTCSAVQEPYLHPRINLLQGPPGTGKTHMIVGLISTLLKLSTSHCSERKTRILLCAPSHAAVDEISCRLISEGLIIDPTSSSGSRGHAYLLRTGSKDRINPVVHPYSLEQQVREKYNALVSNPGKGNDIENQIESVAQQLGKAEKKCSMLNFDLNSKTSARHAAKIKPDLDAAENERNKLQRDLRVLRLSKKKITGKRKSFRQVEEAVLKECLKQADIVATTLSGSGSDPLIRAVQQLNNRRMFFTCVIVDEAAQCTEVDTLIPLQFGSSKLILVGDPCQLPATVKSRTAERSLFGRSLFERFFKFFEQERHHQPSPVRMLREQYRMHPDISSFSSHQFYHGKLLTSSSVMERQPFPYAPLTALDVASSQEQQTRGANGRIFNVAEIKVVVAVCKVLLGAPHYLLAQSIGIITPYREQVERLRTQLSKSDIDGIEVLTVDGFQGREKDLIILSCVRAQGSSSSIGFVKHPQRLNVAMTRARRCLVCVGHYDTLKVSKDWSAFANLAKSGGNFHSVRGADASELMSILTRYTSSTVQESAHASLDLSARHFAKEARPDPRAQRTGANPIGRSSASSSDGAASSTRPPALPSPSASAALARSEHVSKTRRVTFNADVDQRYFDVPSPSSRTREQSTAQIASTVPDTTSTTTSFSFTPLSHATGGQEGPINSNTSASRPPLNVVVPSASSRIRAGHQVFKLGGEPPAKRPRPSTLGAPFAQVDNNSSNRNAGSNSNVSGCTSIPGASHPRPALSDCTHAPAPQPGLNRHHQRSRSSLSPSRLSPSEPTAPGVEARPLFQGGHRRRSAHRSDADTPSRFAQGLGIGAVPAVPPSAPDLDLLGSASKAARVPTQPPSISAPGSKQRKKPIRQEMAKQLMKKGHSNSKL